MQRRKFSEIFFYSVHQPHSPVSRSRSKGTHDRDHSPRQVRCRPSTSLWRPASCDRSGSYAQLHRRYASGGRIDSVAGPPPRSYSVALDAQSVSKKGTSPFQSRWDAFAWLR
ncbi:MAG: hypothetical protein EOS19_25530 [Mesorhizobium sp.]|nr:MAG: hypothetical protein EOS19_25530 [Mesorhizobium sp.]